MKDTNKKAESKPKNPHQYTKKAIKIPTHEKKTEPESKIRPEHICKNYTPQTTPQHKESNTYTHKNQKS